MFLEQLQLSDVSSVAICGGGGKTSLLYALSYEMCRQHIVIATTSTHILQPQETEQLAFFQPNSPADFAQAKQGVVSVFGIPQTATPNSEKKITGIPPMMVDAALQTADYFFYEADGSKHLPLKCHNATEPVIWFGTDAVICVLGLSALGRSAQQVCHRFDLDPLFQMMPNKSIDTDDLVRLALECRKAAGYPHTFRVCFNQCDTDALHRAAQQAASQLEIHGIPCAASCLTAQSPWISAL